jgi:hypothetical protein
VVAESGDEAHEWHRAHIGVLGKDELQRAVFEHPVSGPMTVRQAVCMLEVHMERHIRQIHRLKKGFERDL